MDKEVFDWDDTGIETEEEDISEDSGLVDNENVMTEEYEDEEEYEEEEPSMLMTILILIGAVIIFLTVICAVCFFFFKTEKRSELVVIETQSEMITEEQTESESIETEVATDEMTEEAFTEEQEQIETEDIETEEAGMMEESLEETEETIEETIIQSGPVSGNENMEFTELSETVTAKDVTNLRTLPSTLDETNVVAQLLNGESVTRTGVNEAYGWSRLDYNGQTVYAVSSYLTTDLSYKPPVAPNDPNRVSTQDGRVIIFTGCSDYITPKEYVNLRTEPSTSEGESTVRCQIRNGDTVYRTGYSPDSGWSRVEYNGEVLYVVSSMVYTTE